MGSCYELNQIPDLHLHFPNIASDPGFKIIDKCSIKFNCIAWAYSLFNDRFMQNEDGPSLDGVWYWWPKPITHSFHISEYLNVFLEKGYEKCEDINFEEGFIKIALYVENENNLKCTHAARQKTNGIWMSKMGQSNKIEHSTPYSLEGPAYGKVYCILKHSRY